MIKSIPAHLSPFVAKQAYGKYSAIDQASWRYIMRISKSFFKDHAHKKYITGLKETGIDTEQIPRISEMSKKLKRFGWQAVAVTGFIPPSVFLEFLSLSILPIACDIRRLEHLEYTPAPDIVHEAAGHAPIITDRPFAKFLRTFGEIARKAIFAAEDLEVYEAIKSLSEVKEDTRSTPEQIAACEARLDKAVQNVTYTSEASMLARLGWWSTEYGLVKEKGDFKIYGAGLLSSIGESFDCFAKNIPRRKLDINCVNVNYDITKPQPQLFYVERFKDLEDVIDELAARMSFSKAGYLGLATAKRAQTVNTIELDSGLQISSKLTGVHGARSGEIGTPWTADSVSALGSLSEKDALKNYGELIYLQFSGPTQLSYGDVELAGQSARYHKFGYGTPVGLVKAFKKSPQKLSVKELRALGFKGKSRGRMEFTSGVIVEGVLKKVVRKGSKNLVMTFSDCTVFRDDQVYYQPDWGLFDMACGHSVTSVFGGAADRKAYVAATGNFKKAARAQSQNVTESNRGLIPLYSEVRKLRAKSFKKSQPTALLAPLAKINDELDERFADDWLLRIEILELLKRHGLQKNNLAKTIETHLGNLAAKNETISSLISRGQELL
jgi:phenylalanine-4-hydroxylase